MTRDLAHDRIAVRAAWNLILGVSPLVATILLLPTILRALGIDQYGVLQASLAFAGLFSVADFSFGVALTRFIAASRVSDDEAHVRGLTATAFSIFFGTGLVISGSVFLSAPWVGRALIGAPGIPGSYSILSVRLAAIALLAAFISTFAIGVANGFHRFVVPGAVSAGNLVLTTVGSTVLAVMEFDVRALMSWNAVVSLAAMVALLAYVKRLLPAGTMRLGWDRSRVKELVSFASYSWLGRMASLVGTNLDRIVVSASLGAAAVPYYAVPITLTRYAVASGSLLGVVLFPVAAELQARKQLADLRDLYVRAARVFATLACGLPVILGIAGPRLLASWLGEEFSHRGGAVLSLGSALAGLSLLTAVASYLIEGLGEPRITGTLRLAQNVAGLGLAVLLTPLWGVAGTAWSFLIPAVLTAPAFLYIVEGRRLRLSLLDSFGSIYARPIVVGLFLAAATRGLSIAFPARSVVGALVLLGGCVFLYGGLVLVFRPIPRKDLLGFVRTLSRLVRPTFATSRSSLR